MPTRSSNPPSTSARGRRLFGFDYSSPYFYMVTLKRLPEAPPLSEVADDPVRHWLHPTPLTHPLETAIRAFHETWHCVEAINHYTIMPDHIHLILKILPVEKRLTLPRLVWLLIRALEKGLRPGRRPGAGAPFRTTAGHALLCFPRRRFRGEPLRRLPPLLPRLA